jgi:Tol biopolymer transport system component
VIRTAARGAFWAVLGGAAIPVAGCDDKVLHLDDTPPEVSISAPVDGADVSGVSVRVDVSATDDVGVDRVEFRVNGGAPIVDDTAPWSAVVVTLTEAADATLVIAVEAFDAAGNSVSDATTYTVLPRTTTRLTNDPNDDLNPAWAPDGSRIAFQAKRAGDQFDLWAMDPDGSDAQQLTADVNEDRNPAWSPDGLSIAFDTDRMGTFDVWMLPVAGGEAAAESLTFGNNDDVEPAWSADGQDVYFASSRGSVPNFNIWRVGAGGGVPVQITSFDEDDTAPAVSSDGRMLAFVSTLNLGTAHVYTMAIGVAGVTPLTGDPGYVESEPTWIPQSDVVAFSRDDGIDANVWFQSLGGDTPLQGTFGAGSLGDGGAAWSPDGTKLAFHSDRDGNPEIYVIE